METPLRNKFYKNVLAENYKTPGPKSFSSTKLPASPFLEKLGYGTGVEVLRLKRSTKNCTKSPWAIKMISRRVDTKMSQMLTSRMNEEAEILRKLDHPNIVGFRGFDKLKDGKNYIAMELCDISLGNLLENRFDNDLGPLESKKTKKMIKDVLHGLDYLHTKAMIMHADLKSFNILVKKDFDVCKICDFGVSLPLGQDGFVDMEKTEQEFVGTGLWSAPETLLGDSSLVGVKSDIFSFGLIVYETIALVPPHTFSAAKRSETSLKGLTGSKIKKKLEDSDVICIEDDEDEKENMSVITVNSSITENEEMDEDDEEIDEDDEEMDLGFEELIGTRPMIPECIELSDDYDQILEIFFVCTNDDLEARPDAATILKALDDDN